MTNKNEISLFSLWYYFPDFQLCYCEGARVSICECIISSNLIYSVNINFFHWGTIQWFIERFLVGSQFQISEWGSIFVVEADRLLGLSLPVHLLISKVENECVSIGCIGWMLGRLPLSGGISSNPRTMLNFEKRDRGTSSIAPHVKIFSVPTIQWGEVKPPGDEPSISKKLFLQINFIVQSITLRFTQEVFNLSLFYLSLAVSTHICSLGNGICLGYVYLRLT